MTEIMVMETSKSGSQIAKVKPFIKEFGFTGCGHLIYTVTDENTLKVKHLLEGEIVSIKQPQTKERIWKIPNTIQAKH